MLTQEYLEAAETVLTEIYADLETDVLIEMSKKINGTVGSKNFAQLQQNNARKLYQVVLSSTSKIARRKNAKLNKAFFDAMTKSFNFDKKIYAQAGIDVFDLASNDYIVRIINNGLNATLNTLDNLTGTIAPDVYTTFINQTNVAHLQATTGVLSANKAIEKTIVDICATGITAVNYYSGTKSQLDVATRRAVLGGINQTAGRITEATAMDLGAEHFATSKHFGARTGDGYKGHVNWQGKVFKASEFRDKTGYGKVDGLLGANCRHSFYPFFPGVSQLEKRLDERPEVIDGGKTYSFYEATQRQRAIERNIRKYARTSKALEASGIDATKYKNLIAKWTAEARRFSKLSGVRRRPELEKILY